MVSNEKYGNEIHGLSNSLYRHLEFKNLFCFYRAFSDTCKVKSIHQLTYKNPRQRLYFLRNIGKYFELEVVSLVVANSKPHLHWLPEFHRK